METAPHLKKVLFFALSMFGVSSFANQPLLNSGCPSGHSTFGWAREDGVMDCWFDLNECLKLSSNERLPIRVNFSGRQLNYAMSMLGSGWWFPLLEATAVEEDDGLVVVRLPTGEKRTMTRSKAESKKYKSFDQQWRGLLSPENDQFEVDLPSGWKFIYSQGRLKTAKTPSGELLTWGQKSGKANITGITSNRQGLLLEAQYSPKGILQSLQINGVQPRLNVFTFTSGMRPIVTQMGGVSGVSDMQPVITAIKLTGGYRQAMEYTIGDKGSCGMSVDRKLYDWQSSSQVKLTWEATAGYVLNDEISDYSRPERDIKGVTRTYREDHSREGVYEDLSRGITERLYRNQETTVASTAQAGVHSVLKKVVRRQPDGKESVMFRASYDAAGNLLRGMQRNSANGDPAWIVKATTDQVKAALKSKDGLAKLFPKQQPNEYK